MKIEEKFNKRSAELVNVQPPTIHTGAQYAEGLKLTFYRQQGDPDHSTIAMHMTPHEAMKLAEDLIGAALQRLRANPASLHGNEGQ